ncbi:hypothetical protein Pla175_45080 [Pirellulimonas nuda]|uniref:Peptidase A2 domain-containing protein n=1 Tax=Pirellulimonas nuda TaxID=2528009 RepID=A0A518DHX9_9BACT|nr:hypothetical protein [Pirellulimonas nuda]QDU91090.1 hypothetical protein Pla175_45080 [Pirellulimonas nuda]
MNLRRLTALAVALTASLAASLAAACPFCTAETQSLSEELASADVAVLARLIEAAPTPDRDLEAGEPYGPIDPETGMAKFKVVEVLMGGEPAEGLDDIEAIFFGEADREALFLVRGVANPPEAAEPFDWAIPFEVSQEAAAYIKKLRALPESGPERIAFFLGYLQHEDPLLSQDAYEEFARAPYADLKAIKDRLDIDQLWAWIDSPDTSPSRRRLFFTMLGVCGGPDDIPRLEAMLESDARVSLPAADAVVAASVASGGPMASVLVREVVASEERRKKMGLDAMTACYLTLRGADGLDLIDRRFLADTGADYSHVYSVLMALRFLADEPGAVPIERLMQSARLLLAHPDFADQVVPDLARWEDWGSMDALAKLYRDSFKEDSNRYVREPIVTYLDVAAEQPGDVGERANAALAELEPLDPESFSRARRLSAFGFLGSARAKEAATAQADPADALVEPDATFEETQPAPSLESTADAADDAIPDPAGGVTPTYAEAVPSLEEDPGAPEDTPEATPDVASEAAAEVVPTIDPSAEVSAQTAEVETPTTPPPTAVAATLPSPPNRALLLGAPLAAGGVLMGFFYLLLRGGV